jgi:hypothetical protein
MQKSRKSVSSYEVTGYGSVRISRFCHEYYVQQYAGVSATDVVKQNSN